MGEFDWTVFLYLLEVVEKDENIPANVALAK
jgi:hypothetical protein